MLYNALSEENDNAMKVQTSHPEIYISVHVIFGCCLCIKDKMRHTRKTLPDWCM
jgi:hypothetical protein